MKRIQRFGEKNSIDIGYDSPGDIQPSLAGVGIFLRQKEPFVDE
jgi:hypothetical protein